MNIKKITLSEAEWKIMEFIWSNAPVSGRDVIDHMEIITGWKRTTTLTLIRRMEEKGAIEADDSEKVRIFRPKIQREDAVIEESCSFLDRVYNGSISLMVSTLTQQHKLSQDEMESLYKILEEARGNDS